MFLSISGRVLIGTLLLSYISYDSFSQSTATDITIKSIICPKLCKGEHFYQITFSGTGIDSITSSSGIIRNDTIFNVEPTNSYSLNLTLFGMNGEKVEKIIPLPTCDPILPTAPLVSSKTICANEPLPKLIAIVADNVVVDWYTQSTGGLPVAKNTREFTPLIEGNYYAVSRIEETGCSSLTRSLATLTIERQLCPVISLKVVRLQ